MRLGIPAEQHGQLHGAGKQRLGVFGNCRLREASHGPGNGHGTAQSSPCPEYRCREPCDFRITTSDADYHHRFRRPGSSNRRVEPQQSLTSGARSKGRDIAYAHVVSDGSITVHPRNANARFVRLPDIERGAFPSLFGESFQQRCYVRFAPDRPKVQPAPPRESRSWLVCPIVKTKNAAMLDKRRNQAQDRALVKAGPQRQIVQRQRRTGVGKGIQYPNGAVNGGNDFIIHGEILRILLDRINFYFLLTRLFREFIIPSPCHPEAVMKVLKFSAPALSVLLLCPNAHAQGDDYPNHPIRFIVPYPPGAGSDTFARLVADKLGKRFGQTVFVDNRPGSSGNIGADAVFRAAPDGYTLLFTAPGPLVTSQSLYAKLSFVPDAFVPISVIATSPSTLVANPKTGIKNLQELVSAALENPDKLNYSSGGAGSTPHLAAEMFKQLAKVRIFQIPYAGSGPALTAVVAGETDVAFLDLGSVLPFVRKGQLVALGVGSESRKAALPDTPAIGEVVPGFLSMTWFGLAAPPKTPAHIVNKLSAAVNEILKDPDTVARLSQMNADPIGGTPADMAKFIKQERERWSTVIRNTGTKLD